LCSLLNYMGLCPLPRKFLISKWWGFVHSRWYYLLFRCLFYTQKWCLWSSKTNIFLQNIMQPTYLFNRNKKRTLVAYTCKKDTKCHKYFQIADISAAVFLASECIMLLMSVAAWCPFANQLFTYFKGWKFSKGEPTSFKKSRLDRQGCNVQRIASGREKQIHAAEASFAFWCRDWYGCDGRKQRL